MGDVATVKDKVQRIITDNFGSVQVDREGDFTFRHGSARVFIRVTELGDDGTAVRIFAPTNHDVPATPELFHYIATNNAYSFGGLMATEMEDGTVRILFKYTLFGDTLDPEELLGAMAMVAGTADKVDTEIRDRFGGTTFHDDPE